MGLRNAVGHLALEHAAANGDAHLVSGTAQRYRREFTDPTLAAWDVVTGAGMAVAVASSNLTITTGTTINSVTSLTSKDTFTAPFKAAIGFRISQKIANNDFFFELIAVDDPTEIIPDETIVAAWRVSGTDSTTTTIARTEVRNGQAARSQSANLTVLTQTSDGIYEIVLESDEVSFHNKPVNSTGGKSLSNVWNTVSPDPNKKYKLRIRAANGGTAPASTTTFTASFVSALDYTETLVEITGGQGRTDASGATPVHATGGAVTAVQGTGSTGTIWAAAGHGGLLQADIASAAITATATSAAVIPGLLSNIGAFANSFSAVVTAVSGTTPTMDIAIEESPDNGTNWVRIYEFPRITANGTYTSPLIRSTWGTRYRYVRTIGGTTPSFTMAMNRLVVAIPGEIHKQFFDRSIALNTLNSTTPIYNVDGCDFFQMIVNTAAGATTNPQLQLQGSEDGVNFYAIGTPLVVTPAGTVFSVNKDIFPKFVRATVSTAGVAAVAGYVSLKALRN